MAMHLTDKGVEKMGPPETRQEIPDRIVPGLYLIAQPSGAKSWAVRYRFGGKPRKMTLGRFPVLRLRDARDRAREALATIAAGDDPMAAAAEAKANTFATVADTFMRRYVEARLRPGTAVEYRRTLQGTDVEEWKDRPIASITRRDVFDLLDQMIDRGAETSANRTLAYLRKFFGWAAERGIIEAVPTDRIKPPTKETARTRYLDDDETRDVWIASGEIGFPFQDVFRALLLTGQRASEVMEMEWRELHDLDGSNPQWRLPGDRTKNGLPHVVPLAPAVVDLLTALPRIDGSRYVFTTTGDTPVSGQSKGKRRLDAAIAKAREADGRDPIRPWRLHDLRRTMSTHMHERLGVMPHVVEATINHISGARAGVAGVYNQAKYMDQRREALTDWADHVAELVDA